jgi:hypothetical protein
MQVSNDFDDGEIVSPDPPRKFIEFDMSTAFPKWPRAYLVTMMLAEEDGGGFGSLMQSTLRQVAEKVAEKLAEIGIKEYPDIASGTELASYIGRIISEIFRR